MEVFDDGPGGHGQDAGDDKPDRSEPRGADRYLKEDTLGEGTFGVVHRAVDKVTHKVVAIKKIRLVGFKEGVDPTALREIKLLKELRHENIINLQEVFSHKRNLNLVFDYMESDLELVIRDRSIILAPADIKSYLQMILRGLAFCHQRWVLHRDIKPNNLLISADGTLKLGDFGLARIFGSPSGKLTNTVFARQYRAPELLFGCKHYGAGVDIWAAGCVLGELLLRRMLFNGSTDIEQLSKIFQVLGTPTDASWPGMRSLPDYLEYGASEGIPLRKLFPMASDDCLDLLRSMLSFCPANRPTAEQCLRHRYFSTQPAPTPVSRLPRPPARRESRRDKDNTNANYGNKDTSSNGNLGAAGGSAGVAAAAAAAAGGGGRHAASAPAAQGGHRDTGAFLGAPMGVAQVAAAGSQAAQHAAALSRGGPGEGAGMVGSLRVSQEHGDNVPGGKQKGADALDVREGHAGWVGVDGGVGVGGRGVLHSQGSIVLDGQPMVGDNQPSSGGELEETPAQKRAKGMAIRRSYPPGRHEGVSLGGAGLGDDDGGDALLSGRHVVTMGASLDSKRQRLDRHAVGGGAGYMPLGQALEEGGGVGDSGGGVGLHYHHHGGGGGGEHATGGAMVLGSPSAGECLGSGGTPAVPMSVINRVLGTDPAEAIVRPTLNSADRNSLKRKIDMDAYD
eukprot:jgi/Mesvir1/17750/Mv12101-RA.1